MAVSTIPIPEVSSDGTITCDIDLTSGGTFQQFSCYRVGNIVNIAARVYGVSVPAAGQYFQLEQKFCPRKLSTIGGIVISNNVEHPTTFSVTTSGVVSFSYSSGQTATQISFYGTYPV